MRSRARDERWCTELCERLGIALEVRRPERPEGGNLQAWAREERYRAARELARQSGAADVAAGHTATDQVETILYRLASSPSRRALLGMRPRQGSLIRPLLGFTREQTAAYCRERGLGWREDASNASGAYARGRVRRGLVPALREIHPAAEQNVLALLEVLREEAEVLEELVDDALGGQSEIELERLRAPRARAAAARRPAAGRWRGRASGAGQLPGGPTRSPRCVITRHSISRTGSAPKCDAEHCGWSDGTGRSRPPQAVTTRASEARP